MLRLPLWKEGQLPGPGDVRGEALRHVNSRLRARLFSNLPSFLHTSRDPTPRALRALRRLWGPEAM